MVTRGRVAVFAAIAFILLANYLNVITQMVGVTAAINAVGYLMVIWAFRASFREVNTATWWFATGFAILAGAIILRGLYWDVSLPLFRWGWPETAARWFEITQGRVINLVFNLMKSASFFCALKCRQKLIPEEEQDQWPIWRAWLHPTKIRLLPWRVDPPR